MISVFGSAVGEEEIAAVASCLRSQWMGAGPKVEEFESRFAQRLALPNFTMVNSGSNALYLAVRLLNLPPGTEVILPSFTWVACAQAVVLCGCQPVFADVDLDTHNITVATIRPHLSARTGAIMVVHYAGKPVDLEPIIALGFPIIEDAAHAVDSRWGEVACGARGDIGIYSFDAVKNLASPEGGGLTVRDPDRAALGRSLRYCGIDKSGFAAAAASGRWWEHNIHAVAPKLLSNDLCAAVALAQLRKLDELQQRRRLIWQLYQRELAAFPWLIRPAEAGPGERHSYFTYCIRLAIPDQRDRLAAHLYSEGIYSTLRYHPLHRSRIFNAAASLPISEQLSEQALNLPIHPRLSDDDLAQILTALGRFPL